MIRTKSKKATREIVDSEEAFLELRDTHTKELKKQSYEILDEAEGSHIIISVIYDKQDPTEPDGRRLGVAISGGIHDVATLIKALENAKEELLEQTLAQCGIKDTLHLLAHLADEEVEEE